jgi:hypothetical protein
VRKQDATVRKEHRTEFRRRYREQGQKPHA